jgi:hypothetical protein
MELTAIAKDEDETSELLPIALDAFTFWQNKLRQAPEHCELAPIVMQHTTKRVAA